MVERVISDEGSPGIETVSTSFRDFSGGMLRSLSSSRISENQYSLLINGRTRYSDIRPIKKPLDLSNRIQSGNYQGLVSLDPYLLVFIDGKPFKCNLETDILDGLPVFREEYQFKALDKNVDWIYTEKVPSSFRNLARKATDPTDASAGIKFGVNTYSTPQCVLCQDGLNQPRILFEGGSSRLAGTIDDWVRDDVDVTKDFREYVPIGKQMVYSSDGILYIISPDGTEIYRSVSGRPLDFVIAVDEDGQRLTTLPSNNVEASRLSHRVGYDRIVALSRVNTAIFDAFLSGGILVSTNKFSWIVATNTAITIFGEPTFRNIELFPTGPLNHVSTTNILGDTVLVDTTGLRSFNAISALNNEGQNSPFSKDVDELFADIEQVSPAVISSNNYTYFAIKTKFSDYGVLVYDELRETFASLDIYSNLSAPIKQFAEVKVNGKRRVFFITWDNKLYELNAGSSTETCILHPRELESNEGDVEQKPVRVYAEFQDVKENGQASIQVFVDKKGTTTKTRTVVGSPEDVSQNGAIPYETKQVSTTENLLFKTEDTIRGRRAGLIISFNFDAELSALQLVSEVSKTTMAKKQASKIYS